MEEGTSMETQKTSTLEQSPYEDQTYGHNRV